LKPYRRNYAIGLVLFIIGIAVLLISVDTLIDIIAKVVAAAGVILAGWSGRQWWYYEKQSKEND
jgi:hypothetical protein